MLPNEKAIIKLQIDSGAHVLPAKHVDLNNMISIKCATANVQHGVTEDSRQVPAIGNKHCVEFQVVEERISFHFVASDTYILCSHNEMRSSH